MMIAVLQNKKSREGKKIAFDMLIENKGSYVFFLNGAMPTFFASDKFVIANIVCDNKKNQEN